MKKRTVLLPLSLLVLMSCASKENEDDMVRNRYPSETDCRKDNPKDEIKKNVDEDDWDNNYDPCERVSHGGHTYFLGPRYPYRYYGSSGFYRGYWIGRSTSFSEGVVHSSGQSFTHSQISASGGIGKTISAARGATTTAGGKAISRGGFGSGGHSVGG